MLDALATARGVLLVGPRQAGKTTLALSLVRSGRLRRYVSLDTIVERRAAAEDPDGFVRALPDGSVIDEVQRVPDLLLAVKARLDASDARGQLLLTGSARLAMVPGVVDALPGRVDHVSLWPFSQGELVGCRERFLDRAFEGEVPHISEAPVGRHEYADLVSRGGFPESQTRDGKNLARFFTSYLDGIFANDLPALTRAKSVLVRRALDGVASTSGELFKAAGIGRLVRVSDKTASSYIEVLEALMLVQRLPSWHTNLGKRLAKAPKLHVVDSGLMCRLTGRNARRLIEDGDAAGPVFETFVAMELLRQSGWADEACRLLHYRDAVAREIDIIVERQDGSIIAIEVKASATVRSTDLTAMRFLRDRVGNGFRAGVVIYLGARTVPFGDRIWAVPLEGLWS